MVVAGAIIPEEQSAIEILAANGLDRASATLAVVLFTRRHSRPFAELVHLVGHYPALSIAADAEAAIQNLLAVQMAMSVPDGSNAEIIQVSPNFETALMPYGGSAAMPLLLRARHETDEVRVLGHMGDRHVYSTFGPRLAQAQSEILLPMFNTTSSLQQVELLKARADAGVKIRILYATPGLAASARGNAARATTKSRIKDWKKNISGRSNFQFRVTKHAEDLMLASSMCIDGRLLRLDSYDHTSQRSTQGVMLEFDSSTPLNITTLFTRHFEDAWRRARPIGFFGTLVWSVRSGWIYAVLVGLVVMAVLVHKRHPTLAAALIGVDLGYLTNKIDEIPRIASDIWSRILGK